MEMIKRIFEDELLPHKVGILIGGAFGFVLALMVSGKASEFDHILATYEEEVEVEVNDVETT